MESGKALEVVETVCGSLDAQDCARAEIESMEVDITDLCALRSYLDKVMAATRIAKKALDERLAKELGTNAGIRYGDSFIQARAGRSWKTTQPDELCEFLQDDLKRAINIVNSVRVTSLKAIASERGMDPQVVLDTFGDWVENDDTVTVTPIDKAPRYAQKLLEGERTYRKGKLELVAPNP